MSQPGFGENEPPHGTPEQTGLRITSFVGIKIVAESGFGEKEPPTGTPEQARLRIVPPWARLRLNVFSRSLICHYRPGLVFDHTCV